MSGTLPTSPSFKTANLKSNQASTVVYSESGKRQARKTGGHRWEIDVVYPPMTRAEFAAIFAFALNQAGTYETFNLTLPQFNTPQGIGTGTPLVFTGHSAGVTTILTKGWTVSITGILKAGDLIKFDNHSKVYMLVADANSDVGGNASLTIFPPLVEALVLDEAITVSNVPFEVSFIDGIQEFKTTNPSISTFKMDLVEAFT